jgi:hypothetical protein
MHGMKQSEISLIFFSKSRLRLERRRKSRIGVPVHFFSSVNGGISLGVPNGANSDSLTLVVNDNFVCVSWSDSKEDAHEQEHLFLVQRLLLCCGLCTLYSSLLLTSVVIFDSGENIVDEPSSETFPFIRPFSQTDGIFGFALKSFLLNAFGASAAYDRSPIALTMFISAVLCNTVISASSCPSFLFVLRYLFDFLSVFCACKLRRKLDVCWLASGNTQRLS